MHALTRAAAAAGDRAARSGVARRWAATTSSAADLLASLVNHERSGLPDGAGVAGPTGFDLHRMHRLLHALGNPHASLRAVHVVGSKGKGSVAAMLASSLSAAGYRAGLYTSPHVVDVSERVWVDGAPLPASAFGDLASRHADALRAAAAAEGGALSWFEAVTALALRAFADAGVDVAVLEAGVGGARDATNVFGAGAAPGVPPPLAAVVTPVTLEHAAVLGGDVTSIATVKAGVASGGAPLVVGAQPPGEAGRALAAAAAAAGSPLVDASTAVCIDECSLIPADVAAGRAPRTRVTLSLRAPPPSWPPTLAASLRLFGAHQADNAATAAAAAAVLAGTGGLARLTPAAVEAGLASASLPARFQTFRLTLGDGGAASSSSSLALVLDGAHTRASAAALAAAARAAFPAPTPAALVLATAADKDAAGMAAELRAGLAPVAVVFTEASVGGGRARTAAPGALVAAWQAAPRPPPPAPPRCRELIKAGMAAAVDAAAREVAGVPGGGGGGVVVVAGSLAGAGEAARSVRGLVELE